MCFLQSWRTNTDALHTLQFFYRFILVTPSFVTIYYYFLERTASVFHFSQVTINIHTLFLFTRFFFIKTLNNIFNTLFRNVELFYNSSAWKMLSGDHEFFQCFHQTSLCGTPCPIIVLEWHMFFLKTSKQTKIDSNISIPVFPNKMWNFLLIVKY